MFLDLDHLLIPVAMSLPLTQAEGPGKRFALWVQGCPLRCKGCCNPSFLDAGRAVPMRRVSEVWCDIQAAKQKHDIEGVTFLGGEPFGQAQALAKLAKLCRDSGLSVMIFSGFTLKQLRAQGEHSSSLLDQCDLLVDGPYFQTQHTQNRRFIGSENQGLHFLSTRYRSDDPLWKAPNSTELHLIGDDIIVNGFPPKSGPFDA